MVYNWLRERKHKQLTKDQSHLHMAWEQDYHLQDPGRLALFDEYLEMSKFPVYLPLMSLILTDFSF